MQTRQSCLIGNDIVCNNGNYYVFYGLGNQLYQIDRNSMKVVNKYDVNNGLNNSLLYMSCVVKDNLLYYTPHNADTICIFDMKKGEAEYIPYSLSGVSDGTLYEKSRFSYSFSAKGKVFFLGFNIPAILELDIRTKKIKFIIIKEYKELNYNGWGYFTQGYVELENNTVLLPMGCTGKFIKYNLDTAEMEYLIPPFSDILDGIGGMSVDDSDVIWITSRNTMDNKVIRWCMKDNSFEVISIKSDVRGFGSYYAPIIVGNSVFILPETKDHAYIIDRDSNKIKVLDKLENAINVKSESKYFDSCIVGVKTIDKKIVFFTCWDYAFNEYDVINKTISKYYLTIGENGEKCYQTMIEDKLEKEGVLSESILEFDYFLKNII